MYFHNVVGTRSYTTSTTNMYHKDRFHVPRDDVVGIGRTRTRGGTGNDFDFHMRAQPKPSKRVRDGLVFRYSGTGDIVDDGTGNVHLNHIEKIIALDHTCPCVPTSPTSKDPKTGLHHCNTQSGPVCSSCGRYWK